MISGDWRWIQALALHWPHRPEFHFWAFDLQWWWIGIFDQSMTTHDAFGMAQWQWLKKVWINVKVENTMMSVDADIKKIHEIWDEEESNKRMDVIGQNGNIGLHYSETPSEVDGLNDMSISFSEEEDPSSDDTH